MASTARTKPGKKIAKAKPEKECNKTKDNGSSSDRQLLPLKKEIIEHPQSSEAWIKLIAYYAGKGEIAEARSQTRKALLVITFESPSDKLNLWKGYLNLEFHFGDSDSLVSVYRQACSASGIEAVGPHVVSLFTAAKRFSEAEFYVKDFIKRVKARMVAWKLALTFYVGWQSHETLQKGKEEESEERREQLKDILRRALQSLPMQKHIELIIFYAKAEYEHGNFEAARTNFENLVSNFPRRNDIWSVYIDQEVKHTRDTDHIRSILERVTSVKKNLKQMQSFFNRFLEFEKRNGDDKSRQAVIDKAKHFVENYVSQKDIKDESSH